MKNQWIKLTRTSASPKGMFFEGDYLLLPEKEAENIINIESGIYEDPPVDVFKTGNFQGKSLLYIYKTFGLNILRNAVESARERDPDKNFLKYADEFITDIVNKNAGNCRCPECHHYHKIKSD